MKEIKFVPQAASGKHPKFEGDVTIRTPTNVELWELLEVLGYELGDDGKVKAVTDEGKIKKMAKMVKASLPFIAAVNLTKLKEGTKLSTVDDLMYDRDCQGILTEVATAIIQGFGPGKN
jgi:hypothetical protein